MKSFITLFLAFSFSSSLWAKKFNIPYETFTWGKDVDVFYLPDESLPSFSVQIYFADGALSDGRKKGETWAAFELLTAGTNRYSQKEIIDHLEFLGASYGANVTHEYAQFSFSGLAKDMFPITHKVCHLFRHSLYPDKTIAKELRRAREKISNLVNDHSSLASRAFRELGLSSTPFAYPAGGKINDLKKMSSQGLRNKLDYFNKKVKKIIYLSGPREVLSLKKVIEDNCRWGREKESALFERSVAKIHLASLGKKKQGDLILVEVPGANQAQVRMGGILPASSEINLPALNVATHFLGGGYTSLLMQEVRVKRGLSYGARAISGAQKHYGRLILSSFTKNKTIIPLLDVMEQTTSEALNDQILVPGVKGSRQYLLGSFPFRLEGRAHLLGEFMSLGHQGRSYDDLLKFTDDISKVSLEDVRSALKNYYNFNEMTIVVVGNEDIATQLRKWAKDRGRSFRFMKHHQFL